MPQNKKKASLVGNDNKENVNHLNIPLSESNQQLKRPFQFELNHNYAKFNNDFAIGNERKPVKRQRPKQQKELQHIKETVKSVKQSSHLVSKAIKYKDKKKNPSISYNRMRFLKKHSESQIEDSVPEIEAFTSDLYRLLLDPTRAPKVNSVVDKEKLYGVLSAQLENFQSISDFTKTKQQLTPLKWCEAGMGSLLAASYVLQENDLHGDNYGFNRQRKLSRIDSDQSLAQITLINRLKKSGREQLDFISMGTATTPDQMEFLYGIAPPIDSNNFIKYNMRVESSEAFTPMNSPLNFQEQSHFDFIREDKKILGYFALSEMTELETFRLDKWKVFIKVLLLDESCLDQLINAHLSLNGTKALVKDFMQKRIASIRENLPQILDFKKQLLSHGDQIFAEIANEVALYNQLFDKYHPERKIPLNRILQVEEFCRFIMAGNVDEPISNKRSRF